MVFAPAPASAQTAPPPSPAANPLANLLNPILGAVLQPAPKAPASGPGGASGSQPVGSASARSSQSAALNASIPGNLEDRCGPSPVPLVFNRTPPRTTQQLVAEAQADAPPGTTVQQEMVKIAAPFPVAGSAHYQDDWGAYRSTPCPHLHQGNDVFAPAGTPAVAPENGILVRFDSEFAGGLCYYFAGDDGYSFYGAHLEGFASGVHAGEHVTAGTVLGYVGNTGDAAGGATHLHFELFAPGKAWGTPEDPKFWLDNALSTAIIKAGGTPNFSADSGADQAAAVAAVNPASFLSRMEVTGGNIISQPTVPVLLLVILIVGTLLVVQGRTIRVAAEVRKSKSAGAVVPAYLVSSSLATGNEAAAAEVSKKRKRRRGASPTPPDPFEGIERPVWAVEAEARREAAPRPGLFTRAKDRLPETINKVTTMSDRALDRGRSSGNGSNGNGSGNGHGPGNGHGSWSPASASAFDAKKGSPIASWTPPGVPAGNGKRR
ncbi:MAG TPA: M23 family metallopeptidase [Actinomycetota bacterium]|nr:M23 family metallopeptidase [Actinomycetota bacterium]